MHFHHAAFGVFQRQVFHTGALGGLPAGGIDALFDSFVNKKA